jgi:hypothetical protein
MFEFVFGQTKKKKKEFLIGYSFSKIFFVKWHKLSTKESLAKTMLVTFKFKLKLVRTKPIEKSLPKLNFHLSITLCNMIIGEAFLIMDIIISLVI